MGSEKRDRQRAGRIDKAVAQQAAAKRARTKRTGVRLAVAAVVVLGVAFAISLATRKDNSSGSDATSDKTTTTAGDTTSTGPTTSAPTYSNPALAAEVLHRKPPSPAKFPANTPPDALEKTTLIKGQGAAAKAGDTVTVHYVGYLSDGKVFDSSWQRGQPFPLANVGNAQVIKGWNEGLIGARIGERRRLVIGADKAYGSQSPGEAIPANSPLGFVIDVVDVTPAAG